MKSYGCAGALAEGLLKTFLYATLFFIAMFILLIVFLSLVKGL